MKFKNHCISFNIPGKWSVMRHFRDAAAWNFIGASNHPIKSFGVRLISKNRFPFTKRYLELDDPLEFSSPPICEKIENKPIVFRKLNKENIHQWKEVAGHIYVVLIAMGDMNVRVRAILADDSNVAESFSWLKTFHINIQAALELFDEIEKYVFRIDDFLVIYREMLGMDENETLLRLENATFNFRDDIEDMSSWFHHEHTIYSAFSDILCQRLSVEKISCIPYEEGRELLGLFYEYHHGDVAENTHAEWVELRERFDKKLETFICK